MSQQQSERINQAFADATPEAGIPEITYYPDGAYSARARSGDVHVDVQRTAQGEVTAQYTTTGTNAVRGVATADSHGGGSSQMVFGPPGDRSAEYAASRLARTLAAVQ